MTIYCEHSRCSGVPVTAENRMAPLRQVPWYSNREWLDVYQGLFDPRGRRAALARIAIWELKSNKVPVAVSATRQLLECVRVDEEQSNSASGLQMMYGAAIVRFVNSYADLVKNKALGRSIADIWRELGLPLEVVQVRHAITHGTELPTLDRLRHVASLSIEFLRKTYWDSLAPSMEKTVVPASKECGIASLLHILTTQLSFPSHYYLAAARRGQLQEVLFSAADSAVKGSKAAAKRGDEESMRLVEWVSSIKRLLPTTIVALERNLASLSDAVILSLLEDFLFICIDPLYNVGAVVAVFWILGRGSSAGLATKFISNLISKVIRKDFSKDFDHYCNTSALHSWLNAIDSNADPSQVAPGTRLIDWLYTLLLIPVDVNVESEVIKLDPTVELTLRIFSRPPSCGSLTKRKLSAELINQERFLQRLATIMNLTNSRVLSACRANAHVIARAALDFILPSNEICPSEDSHQLVLRLLKAFAASDLRGSLNGLSPLFSWLLNRLSSPRVKKSDAAHWANRIVEVPPSSYQLLNEIRGLTLSYVDPSWGTHTLTWTSPNSHLPSEQYIYDDFHQDGRSGIGGSGVNGGSGVGGSGVNGGSGVAGDRRSGLKRRSPNSNLPPRPIKRGRLSPKRKYTCDGTVSRDAVEQIVHFDALKLETMKD